MFGKGGEGGRDGGIPPVTGKGGEEKKDEGMEERGKNVTGSRN